MTPASSEPRYHSLDALRGFALLLGVFFHAAESFCPERWSWAIVDRAAHPFFDFFQHTCHAFRMEVFFLMAGFFAHLLMRKRGRRGWVVNRLKRILGPLVVGWVILYPLLIFLWLTGSAMTGNYSRLPIPPEAQSLPAWQLTLGILLEGHVFGDAFNLTHLWFLHQLLVIYVLALAVGQAWRSFESVTSGPSTALRSLFEWSVSRGRLVPVYAALTVPILWGMDGWGVDTPNESLAPHLPTTLLYGLCFWVGWNLFSQPGLLDRWPRNWVFPLGVGLSLALATWTFSRWSPHVLPDDLPRSVAKVFFSVLYAVMMWSLVAAATGLFLRHCAGESRGWRYVADSSYWVYLVHLPVVVAVQLWVAGWAVAAVWKYAFIMALALPLLYLSYHYLVRSTWMGMALNGRRYPREWPWQRRKEAGVSVAEAGAPQRSEGC